MHLWLPTMHLAAFQVVLVVNNPPAQAGDVRVSGSIPGSGRSPGGGHGNLLQYSCLENPMDWGAWRATVHRVTRRVRHDWRDFTHTACIWPSSKSEVTQLCPTLCDPMDYSLLGCSIHGIFQARILERVAISFSRLSSQPGDRTRVSCIAGRCFYPLSHQGSPSPWLSVD